MKKYLLLALLSLLGMTASAQYEDDIYIDTSSNYGYQVATNVDLTGEQWHTDDVSILAAANNLYLIVNGANQFVRTLCMPRWAYYERLWRYPISSYRPYYYNGCLGWYVVANLVNYFIYPDGRWCRLSYVPHYYPYRYRVAHRHYLDFRNWHFRHPRPRNHYAPPRHAPYVKPRSVAPGHKRYAPAPRQNKRYDTAPRQSSKRYDKAPARRSYNKSSYRSGRTVNRSAGASRQHRGR